MPPGVSPRRRSPTRRPAPSGSPGRGRPSSPTSATTAGSPGTGGRSSSPPREHEGGYLPFELALDGALRFDGPNELVVRVIDPATEADAELGFSFAEIPHGKQSWYGPVGGIWQGVYVERRPSTARAARD